MTPHIHGHGSEKATGAGQAVSLFSENRSIMRKLVSVLIGSLLLFCVAMLPAHGEQLPDGLNVKDFMDWIAPGQKNESVRIIQARSWNKNQYVIMVCAVKSISITDTLESQEEKCGEGKFDVYIGVISRNDKNYTFDFRTDVPVSMDMSDMRENGYYSYNLGLDLAPYRVNENVIAIAFRRTYVSYYVGGGSGQGGLWLFMPHEKQLLEILNLEVESHEIIAGDWNPDGSRNRGGYDDKSTLHVLKTKTNGFYDYLVKTVQHNYEGINVKKSTQNTRYVWSQEKRQYVPKGVNAAEVPR